MFDNQVYIDKYIYETYIYLCCIKIIYRKTEMSITINYTQMDEHFGMLQNVTKYRVEIKF